MSTRLDGKNIHDWKQAYTELITAFIEYAEHLSGCRSAYEYRHKHNFRIDNRIVCDAQPCTCGLAQKLGSIMDISYTEPCPDRDTKVLPFKILGIPVHQSDTLPPDTLAIQSSEQLVTINITANNNSDYCVFRDAAKCREWRDSLEGELLPCTLKHRDSD